MSNAPMSNAPMSNASMSDLAAFDAWCALVERALIDDGAEAWAAVDEVDVPAIPGDTDVTLRMHLAHRVSELLDQVAVRRAAVADELGEISDERRHLAQRSRGITSYHSAEALPSHDAPLSYVWAG